MKWGKWKFAIC